MGRLVVVAYRPQPGKEDALLACRSSRRPRTQRWSQFFEWEDGAIERVHTGPVVAGLWKRCEAVCEHVPLAALPEASTMFAEFEPVN
jgi:hypothetical protein